MEIYRDNAIEKGFRPQVLAWRLPTEPWVFAIDKQGRVAARLEGAFSAAELEEAVEKATR
jgi:predicted transcriptional regulator